MLAMKSPAPSGRERQLVRHGIAAKELTCQVERTACSGRSDTLATGGQCKIPPLGVALKDCRLSEAPESVRWNRVGPVPESSVIRERPLRCAVADDDRCRDVAVRAALIRDSG